MSSRAPGSLTTIRALLFDPPNLGGGVRRFLGSPAPVWICGVSFVLAGLAGICFGLAEGWSIFRELTAPYAGDDRLYKASVALRGLHALLLAVGSLGLHVLLTKRYRWTWGLSAVGTLLAVAAGVGFCAGALYELLVEPSYYSSWDALRTVFLLGYFGQPVGVVLLGVAALWSRGLGRWRVLPLFAGLVGSPLSQIILWWLFPPGDGLVVPGEGTREAFVEALRFASPAALVATAWMSVGFAVFGIREREAAALAKGRRATESGNLFLAPPPIRGGLGGRERRRLGRAGRPGLLRPPA